MKARDLFRKIQDLRPQDWDDCDIQLSISISGGESYKVEIDDIDFTYNSTRPTFLIKRDIELIVD